MLLASLLAAACGLPQEDAESALEDEAELSADALVVSLTPDRASPRPLNGLKLAQKSYVFFSGATRSPILSVEFFLDDVSQRIERERPYDFAGGAPDGSANAYLPPAGDGTHRIRARVTTTRRVSVVEAQFSTGGTGTTTPPPPSLPDAGSSTPDAGTSTPVDAGTPPPPPPPPSSGSCDTSGAIGLQATPGVKSPVGSLTRMGAVTLSGQTLTGVYITGAVRGYGTIRDSVIAANVFVAVSSSGSAPLILEDVTVGLEGQKMGDLGVSADGSGGIQMRRVRIVGYADCLRNGPMLFENSWCSTTQQTSTDHNDGYQAYLCRQAQVTIRCSVIENLTSSVTAGIFHADGSQVDFTIENSRIAASGSYCVRLHSAAKYNELPGGDTVDNSRVSVMRNVECQSNAPGYWVDAIPVGTWENVRRNGALVAKP